MPAVVPVVATVLALVVMLGTAYAHPRAGFEVVVAAVAAGGVLAVGAVTPHEAWEQARLLLPVVVFLAAVLTVADLCAAEGLFDAVGSMVARAGRGDPRRLLRWTFLAAAGVTAVLSLDATVVLLTPVVASAALASRVPDRPVVQTCVRLANSASLLLPVSNLTNLLAVPSLPTLSFLGFAAVMAPVWVTVLVVEYVGLRLGYAGDLTGPGAGSTGPVPQGEARPGIPVVSPAAETDLPGTPVVPLVVVAAMLAGFAALSPVGVEPAWPAVLAAAVLGVHALVTRRTTPVRLLRSTQLPFVLSVLGLGVVVAALTRTFLGDLVGHLVPDGSGLPALLGVALLATVLANLVNNLPATLLLVPLVAPAGSTAVLAALIGLGAGSGLSYTGSLANLLWRRTLLSVGRPPSGTEFHRLAALVTFPGVLLGTVVLWAWAPLVG